MSSRHIRPPSPALAVALLALFVSVGGTSYAVKKISSRDIVDGAIKSIDIRNGEIRSADVRDGSLRAKDFARGELPSGTAGAQGPAGPAGATGPPGSAGSAGDAGPYAHVFANGTLDPGRTTPGIGLTRRQFALSQGSIPVYCFDLPAQPANVVATDENGITDVPPPPPPPPLAPRATGMFQGHYATVDPALMATLGCPSGSEAAVYTTLPNGGLYAAFRYPAGASDLR